nr:serine/threonine-protein kinase D6PKL2 [Tanacetum cinerariifolium]
KEDLNDHRGHHRRRHYRRLPQHQLQLHHPPPRLSPHFPAIEPPWTTEDITAEEITKDFQSISFNSTTTTTAIDINRSTSFITSKTTWTTATYSSSSKPTLNPSPTISLHDLRFIHRLGAGDIGSVYLSKMKKLPLVGSTLPAVFAAKVMDRRELASRNKEGRSKTEREILEALDHSFLPRLYAAIETRKWTCLLTEFSQVFSGPNNPTSTDHYTFEPPKVTSLPCIIPNCILPSVSCFNTKRRRKKKLGKQTGPQFVAEPVDV